MSLVLEPVRDMSDSAPLSRGPDLPALLGPAAWRRLHPEVRRRFSCHGSALPVIYDGRLEVRRSTAGALFALLAGLLGGPLPLRQCAAASALVQVRGNGNGGLIWERWIRFSDSRKSCCVCSVKRLDGDGRLLECIEGGLGMVLTVFEEHGALIFESHGYFLMTAAGRLPLPFLMTPGRCRVAHRAVETGRFEFCMTITHPFWGRTFFQTGIFNDPETPP